MPYADPEKRKAAKRASWMKRMENDPAYREAENARRREFYHRNAEEQISKYVAARAQRNALKKLKPDAQREVTTALALGR